MFDFLPKKYRYFVIIGLVAMVASTVYRNRNADWIKSLLRPAPPPMQIKFDNGSVRDQQARAPKEQPSSLMYDPIPPGVMRKCLRGQEALYSDQSCPEGYQSTDIKGGNVTVMPGGIVPMEVAKSGESSGSRKTLHDALDISTRRD